MLFFNFLFTYIYICRFTRVRNAEKFYIYIYVYNIVFKLYLSGKNDEKTIVISIELSDTADSNCESQIQCPDKKVLLSN